MNIAGPTRRVTGNQSPKKWDPSVTSHGLGRRFVNSTSAPQMGRIRLLPSMNPRALGAPQGSSTLHQDLELGVRKWEAQATPHKDLPVSK